MIPLIRLFGYSLPTRFIVLGCNCRRSSSRLSGLSSLSPPLGVFKLVVGGGFGVPFQPPQYHVSLKIVSILDTLSVVVCDKYVTEPPLQRERLRKIILDAAREQPWELGGRILADADGEHPHTVLRNTEVLGVDFSSKMSCSLARQGSQSTAESRA